MASAQSPEPPEAATENYCPPVLPPEFEKTIVDNDFSKF